MTRPPASEPEDATEHALRLARRHLPEAKLVTAVFDHGWRHVGYEIDGRFVLKIRRSAAPNELGREALVLRHLSAETDLPVPRLIGFGEDSESGIYDLAERVPGTLLAERAGPWPESVLSTVAEFAATLHAVAVEPLIRDGLRFQDIEVFWSDGVAWLQAHGYLQFRQAATATARFHRQLERFSASPPVLLHGDLWPVNVFVDGPGDAVTGVIDFGGAAIGPAAWELALPGGKDDLWSKALATAYAKATGKGDDFIEEVDFYRMVRCVGLAAFTEQWAKAEYWTDVVETTVAAALEAARRD